MNTKNEPKQDSRRLVCNDLLADLKRTLDAAVRDYEAALMRKPTDEEEIRRAVDKCVSAREQYNAAYDLANHGIPFCAYGDNEAACDGVSPHGK